MKDFHKMSRRDFEEFLGVQNWPKILQMPTYEIYQEIDRLIKRHYLSLRECQNCEIEMINNSHSVSLWIFTSSSFEFNFKKGKKILFNFKMDISNHMIMIKFHNVVLDSTDKLNFLAKDYNLDEIRAYLTYLTTTHSEFIR